MSRKFSSFPFLLCFVFPIFALLYCHHVLHDIPSLLILRHPLSLRKTSWTRSGCYGCLSRTGPSAVTDAVSRPFSIPSSQCSAQPLQCRPTTLRRASRKNRASTAPSPTASLSRLRRLWSKRASKRESQHFNLTRPRLHKKKLVPPGRYAQNPPRQLGLQFWCADRDA